MKINDVIEVNIEKLAYGNEGIARVFEDNFVVFVKDAIKGEKLKVKITSLNKKFARAQIVEIIEPSPHRIKPLCALYNACGSCDMQICEYDFLLEQKTTILKDTFKNLIDGDKIYPVIKSPDTIKYRHKIQMPCNETKNSKRVLIGYFRENSHQLTNVKFCPMQPEIVNNVVNFIRENYKLGCYSEKTHLGLLKNILIRINLKGEILLTFVLNTNEDDFINYESQFFKFCKKITAQFSEIKGVFINFNHHRTNKILSNDTIKISGQNYIIEKLETKSYKIGSESFFQINPKSAVNLFNIVKDNIKENSTILDAYGGVGAIGIFVSEKASHITLVEENENAVKMAYDNFELNNIKNFEILKGDAKEHFKNFHKQKKQFDYIILDPPRKGCDKQGLIDISLCAKNIIYVSCNPQTLKRDSSYLIENNFKLKFIQGVDLFPFTHHIECVGIFEKVEKC